jgi:putative addiction module antidote
MLALKITKIGNSSGLLLPKEAMARLQVEPGDTVYLTDSPDGFRLTPYDPDFERQSVIMRRVARKRRNVLRELAK